MFLKVCDSCGVAVSNDAAGAWARYERHTADQLYQVVMHICPQCEASRKPVPPGRIALDRIRIDVEYKHL